MALSHGLAQGGNAPEKLDVTATSTFVPGTGITQMKLDVTGTVPGIDEAAFVEAAEGCARQLPRLRRAQGQRRDPARRAARELGGHGLAAAAAGALEPRRGFQLLEDLAGLGEQRLGSSRRP